MLDSLIQWSLRNRLTVLALAVALLVYGGWSALRLPVDVFPDLTVPTVTLLTESRGFAPEEVESLVTLPIEAAVTGRPGVERVRSSSAYGLSLVHVEFRFGTDIYRARQLVTEKLGEVRLPAGVGPPVLGPIASTMGEIMLISLTSEATSPMELRSLAEWVVRPRLLAVPGVSQVIVIGGETRQFQVLVDPARLTDHRLTLQEVSAAAAAASANAGGGFLEGPHTEQLIRGRARVYTPEDLAASVITVRDRTPILIRNVATVRAGPARKRGDGSFNGRPAVVATIQKQPQANTLQVTRSVEAALGELARTLPEDVTLDSKAFQQADFIRRAVANVGRAVGEAALLVSLLLFPFLWNVRTTLITLSAIPLSLLTAVVALHHFGLGINTMTLGGLAIAIGELVDDAIVDVENVFRRLQQNDQRTAPLPPVSVVFRASSEIRNSIVYATLIVILVFVPLFSLSGVEGRLFAPLGVAYVISIAASLLVALTVTPVLCYYLLGHSRPGERGDSHLVAWLKQHYRRILNGTLQRPGHVLLGSTAMLAAAVAVIPFLGAQFLPAFNEGTLNINTVLPPGTSLRESNRIGNLVEETLRRTPEVISTTRRTGRAERDEHAAGVNQSELEVVLGQSRRRHPEIMREVRENLARIPGVHFEVGQPISHRIDHLLSGARAQIAVKLFGPDLAVLRSKGEEIRRAAASVPGVVDLMLEPQVGVPQVQVNLDRQAAAAVGLRAGDVADAVETAFFGRTVSQVLEQQRIYDMVVRLDDDARRSAEAVAETLVDTPVGAKVPLAQVAELRLELGPNTIQRENMQRRILVQANVAERDLASVVEDIRSTIESTVALPEGYSVAYGGQFEAQQKASRQMAMLGVVSIAGIFLLLYLALGSVRAAVLVMTNLPLALIGGVFMIWASGGIVSVASLIGFITLFGIATRNGIMLVSHYGHLLQEERVGFREAIVRGSLERLSPILMTALVTGGGVLPLALGAGQPGKEIQQPLAVVILGGIVTSTLLNLVVIPALYWKYGLPPARPATREAVEITA
jgi:CzcA family heavy metal efflux pump